eukprot:scaffold281032_cov30-Tisochrysis_lutea.AAC.1
MCVPVPAWRLGACWCWACGFRRPSGSRLASVPDDYLVCYVCDSFASVSLLSLSHSSGYLGI